MPLPKDFRYRPQYEHGQLLHVNDVAGICPYCSIMGLFLVKSYSWSPNEREARMILQCTYTPCQKQSYVCLGVNLGQARTLDDFYMHPSRAVAPRHVAVPTTIAEDWEEAQRAMEASAVKATAVMCRRVLYGVLLDKKCKLHPIGQGTQQLITENRLPAIFDVWLPAIKDDGHDGAHPDRALNVSAENIVETMEYTSELLKVLYIEPWEFEERKKRITAAKAAAPHA